MNVLLCVVSLLWIVFAALLIWSFSLDDYIDTPQDRIVRMARVVLCAAWPLTLVALLLLWACVEIISGSVRVLGIDRERWKQ